MPGLTPESSGGRYPRVRWFAPYGCVVERSADSFAVYVGGALIGQFDRGELGERNVLLVGLSADPRIHLGALADAFGITAEALRLIRRQYEAEGLTAVVARRRGGSHPKLTSAESRRLEKLFAAGLTAVEAYAKLRRPSVGLPRVRQLHRSWKARVVEATASLPEAARAENTSSTPRLPGFDAVAASVVDTCEPGEVGDVGTVPAEAHQRADSTETIPEANAIAEVEAIGEAREVIQARELFGTSEIAAALAGTVDAGAGVRAIVPTRTERGAAETPAVGTVRSAAFVQHVGTWLALGMLERHGLYEVAEKVVERRSEGLAWPSVRVAMDAFVAALVIGQGCAEGVRRLATPTAPLLLRSSHAPSPSWVRTTLGRLADCGGAYFHLGMAGRYIRGARAAQSVVTPFYVDNHLRPYTGKEVIRRGWRMQDKRVRPGSSDYYVHDEEGRPLWRFDAPAHGSLTEWLLPVAHYLRFALGEDARILLAFDRAGSYPEALAELREDNVEFVTYERRPYPALLATAFDQEVELDGETYRYCEARANLGGGRGRVKRIAIRTPEERQINLLAISEEPAAWLIERMFGRWCQENGLKHSVERWGINQLDARKTLAYPPDTIVPNPARRRLDHALRLARMREGEARCLFAERPEGHPRRGQAAVEIAQARTEQDEILARRPTVPKRAPLAETELAGKLVYHKPDYKMTLDTIRIACANIEDDLATWLAPHLLNPDEAKKTVANLLAAPGRVRVDERVVRIDLLPAATTREQSAFNKLLAEVNALQLRLPGDPDRRRLRFGSQR